MAIDTVDPNGAWISDGRSGLDEVEFNIDLERTLSKLTELQRFCFVEVVLKGKTLLFVSNELKMTHQAVDKHVRAAKKKFKKYF